MIRLPLLNQTTAPKFGKVSLNEIDQALADKNNGLGDFKLVDNKTGAEYRIDRFTASPTWPSIVTLLPGSIDYLAFPADPSKVKRNPWMFHMPEEAIMPFQSGLEIDELDLVLDNPPAPPADETQQTLI